MTHRMKTLVILLALGTSVSAFAAHTGSFNTCDLINGKVESTFFSFDGVEVVGKLPVRLTADGNVELVRHKKAPLALGKGDVTKSGDGSAGCEDVKFEIDPNLEVSTRETQSFKFPILSIDPDDFGWKMVRRFSRSVTFREKSGEKTTVSYHYFDESAK
jgi:hypothetical protein